MAWSLIFSDDLDPGLAATGKPEWRTRALSHSPELPPLAARVRAAVAGRLTLASYRQDSASVFRLAADSSNARWILARAQDNPTLLRAVLDNRGVTFTDPFGLCPPPPGTFDPLCVAVNVAAGFGDAVTFGLTARFRGDADAQVDKSSATYALGQVAGVAATTALGGAIANTVKQGAVMATSAPARWGATLVVRAGEGLFGTGGSLNTGGALRIGVGKHAGRAMVRAAGSFVKAVSGSEHVNLVDLGRLADWF